MPESPFTSAVVRVTYPPAPERIGLRGSGAGLDWETDHAPDAREGDVCIFHLAVPRGDTVEFKVVRGEADWMKGRNEVVCGGDVLELYPSFESARGRLTEVQSLEVPEGQTLRYRVWVPPSYDEQPLRHYPVLYLQDGQAVWSDSEDPFGTLGLDGVLDDLWELDAMAEILVVSVETGVERLKLLGPIPDLAYGGGEADGHLHGLVEHLKPRIDSEFRTHPDRGSTHLMGASMGALFSFYAAWQRPDVFGGAICLSPSLWWGERFMIQRVRAGACPNPRPRVYLDSGAAAYAHESDSATRDGVHAVRAMYRALVAHCYEPEDDLYMLVWPGHRHNPSSWAERVAIPLQLFFPRL